MGKMVFYMVDSQFAVFGDSSPANHFFGADVAQSGKLVSTLTDAIAYFYPGRRHSLFLDNKTWLYPA
jgi:hypothetical protein